MRRLVSGLGYGGWLDKPLSSVNRASADQDPAAVASIALPVSSSATRFAGREAATSDQSFVKFPPIVHVAGTKGKGSVSAMLSQILSASGIRTGTFTSPHLDSLHWRFCIDGQPASDADLLKMAKRLFQVEKTWEASPDSSSSKNSFERLEKPTFFELTSAGAVDHFVRNGCQAIVLEVGLGGRLDSTNVFSTDLAVITSIGLDHQKILGDTHAEIAAEKAGILKSGLPLICGVRQPDARRVIIEHAAQLGCPSYLIEDHFEVRVRPSDTWGTHIDFSANHPELGSDFSFDIAMEGKHQADNAAIAVAAARVFSQRHLDSFQTTVQLDSLANVHVPARLERFELPSGTNVILDTAHNADSVEALRCVLQNRVHSIPESQRPDVMLIWANSSDKDVQDLLGSLEDSVDRILLTQYLGNPRRQSVEDAWNKISSSVRQKTNRFEDPKAALTHAVECADSNSDENGAGKPHAWIVVAGSFFLAAELRPLIRSLARSECKP